MKIRLSSLLVSVLALSACGGSSGSSSPSRNGLLDTTTVLAAPTTTTAGATTTIVPTTTTLANAASSSTTVAPAVTTSSIPVLQVSSSTTLPTLIPVPTSTTTTVAPTATTMPKIVVEALAKTMKDTFKSGTCGSGGMCQITTEKNSKGPKGGLIIGVSEAGFSTANPAVSNHFLEMARPKIIDTCNGFSPNSYSPLGSSKTFTSVERTKELIATGCVSARDIPEDWYIPGDEEANYITEFLQRCSLSRCTLHGGDPKSYKEEAKYLTTSNTCGFGSTFFYPSNYYLTQAPTCFNPKALNGLKHQVWVILVRSFGPTVRACAVGGPCKTGDVGPYGGIVLDTGTTQGNGNRFLEALTSPDFVHAGAWCGDFLWSGAKTGNDKTDYSINGKANTELLRNDGTSGLPCDVVLSQDGRTPLSNEFFVPAINELKLLCTTAKSLKRLDSVAQKQCGWSTEPQNAAAAKSYLRCPVSISCAGVVRGGPVSFNSFVWSSTPGDPADNRVMTSASSVVVWSFVSSDLSKKPPYKKLSNGSGASLEEFNTSIGITIPFREFTAPLAK